MKNINAAESCLMDVTELSKFLNVPLSKIYSLTRQKGANTIPRYKIGKYLRFNKAEIQEWLEAQRHGFKK